MPNKREQIIHAAKEFESLAQLCSSQTHVSHYTLQQSYDRLIASCEPLDDSIDDDLSQHYTESRRVLDAALQILKDKNQDKMLTIDFQRVCMGLIRRDDLENLKGLVDVAEYFGVGKGPTRMDVVSALYDVYDAFRDKPHLRIPGAKSCVDFISDALHEPRFYFEEATRTSRCLGALYGQNDVAKTLQTIFEFDDVNRLMVWMADASIEDAGFALRLAASSQASAPPECFMFLLRRTKPDETCMKLSLLAVAADKPEKRSTKQTAMHRVVRSGNTQTALMILDRELNPSHDLLRQLLVRDRLNKRPIDYIENIEDVISQSLMIKRIRTALDTYKSEPRYGLGDEDTRVITAVLDRLDASLREKYDFGACL